MTTSKPPDVPIIADFVYHQLMKFGYYSNRSQILLQLPGLRYTVLQLIPLHMISQFCLSTNVEKLSMPQILLICLWRRWMKVQPARTSGGHPFLRKKLSTISEASSLLPLMFLFLFRTSVVGGFTKLSLILSTMTQL